MGKELYLPAERLSAALADARRTLVVVAGLFTSERCPYCVAVKKDQLGPRMRSSVAPTLVVVEFDIDDNRLFTLPDRLQITPTEFGKRLGFSLTPTLFMPDRQANPIAKPLVGYSSRDFYGAYLEEQIQTANRYWKEMHH